MNSEFKIIIKPIKPKVKELDPVKIEALKEKRRLQREARKNKPVEPKEPKVKPDYTEEIENINKTLKNLVGFSIDEINDKLKASKPSTIQYGLPTEPEVVPNKKSRKKSQ
jgi:hypothetical protein